MALWFNTPGLADLEARGRSVHGTGPMCHGGCHLDGGSCFFVLFAGCILGMSFCLFGDMELWTYGGSLIPDSRVDVTCWTKGDMELWTYEGP